MLLKADTSGESLSKELLTFIDEAGLDRMKMRSQCYDGAGNMTGKAKGVGSRIKKQLPKALPFWANCSLLAVSRTSSADNENHSPASLQSFTILLWILSPMIEITSFCVVLKIYVALLGALQREEH
jgi:hypothetical protein